eukprot:CAMPEP_0177277064 /NCGR_PEP_ID=MMETSP0367-20130122/68598_1 /TAXON_ID=447022 ORGANISM="Scrippsiella hangoei-like, Strain SHHI-4" /NCGR_SAMPLE_ID=MMETSP0367 /ASSEMBLY_ACC=CAM_ASM_000362 /LENGTH=62 /DNA_ID=CAMNT_0018733635 /DNA_START=54 /DNA_END=239 /DNA_ORIENTATION=+
MFHSSAFLSPPMLASTSQSPSSVDPTAVPADERHLWEAAQRSPSFAAAAAATATFVARSSTA